MLLRTAVVPVLVLLTLVAGAPALCAAQEDTHTAGSTPAAGEASPSDGWSLHVDAKLHFPGDPEMVAHHYCSPVAGGWIECQLFDGDGPDARLVGVEAIVDEATYRAFDAAERRLWHFHEETFPLGDVTLPDLSPAEAAPIVEQLEATYGKIYLLWDPSRDDLPVGQPSVVVLG